MKISILISILFFAILLSAQNNCYTIVAGKNSTTTGSVIVAHNEDDYGDLIVNLYKVPQVRLDTPYVVPVTPQYKIPVNHTNSYIWFEVTKQKFGDFFVNEFGVTICSNACRSREDTAKGSIDYGLRQTVAKYASSAKQAVLLAAELVEKYGYNSSGRTYCFADANEAWLMAIVQGKHWVAERVPDDEVAIVPNYYTIGEIDLNDSSNFMASSDIIEYAKTRGWYNPERDGNFNFRKAYSNRYNLYAMWNIPRHWAGVMLLIDKKVSLYDNFPFAFIPTSKISIEDMMKVLSYHYENTDLETSQNSCKNPHQNVINRICNSGTKFSVVVELHNTYPENNKNIIWFAPLNPCINAYIPIACSIDSFPERFHKYSWQNALKHHFEDRENNFETNTQHAYSVFHNWNETVNNNYWTKSKTAKKLKADFEKHAKSVFNKKPTGQTSYDLLSEYIGKVSKP